MDLQRVQIRYRRLVIIGHDDYGVTYHLIVQFLNDTNLGNNVVLKPQSRNTLHWLQTSLLCMIPIIPRPPGDVLNFTDSLCQVIIFSTLISPSTHRHLREMQPR
jgi:hypothetical protein